MAAGDGAGQWAAVLAQRLVENQQERQKNVRRAGRPGGWAGAKTPHAMPESKRYLRSPTCSRTAAPWREGKTKLPRHHQDQRRIYNPHVRVASTHQPMAQHLQHHYNGVGPAAMPMATASAPASVATSSWAQRLVTILLVFVTAALVLLTAGQIELSHITRIAPGRGTALYEPGSGGNAGARANRPAAAPAAAPVSPAPFRDPARSQSRAHSVDGRGIPSPLQRLRERQQQQARFEKGAGGKSGTARSKPAAAGASPRSAESPPRAATLDQRAASFLSSFSTVVEEVYFVQPTEAAVNPDRIQAIVRAVGGVVRTDELIPQVWLHACAVRDGSTGSCRESGLETGGNSAESASPGGERQQQGQQGQLSLHLFYGPGVRFGFHRQRATASYAYVALVASPEQELLFQYAEGAQVVPKDLTSCPLRGAVSNLPLDESGTGAMCLLQRFALGGGGSAPEWAADDNVHAMGAAGSVQDWLASNFVVFPLSWPQRSAMSLLRVLGLLAPNGDGTVSPQAANLLDALDSPAATPDIFGKLGSQVQISVDDFKLLQRVADKHAEAYRFAVGLSVLQDQLLRSSAGGGRRARMNGDVQFAAVEPKCAVPLLRDQLRARISPDVRHLLFVHYPKTAGTTLRIALKVFAQTHQVPFHSCYSKNKGRSGHECELQVDPEARSAELPFEVRGASSGLCAHGPSPMQPNPTRTELCRRSPSAMIHYGHSVLWGYHQRLPPGEPYLYVVMTRDPLSRRISDFIFQKEQRSEFFEGKVKQHKLAATLEEHLLDCRSERGAFTGLVRYVFDEHAATTTPAFSEPWKDKLCLLAQHFVIVSTENFDESLRLLSRTVAGTSTATDRAYAIKPRDNKKANVMANDDGHRADRSISLRALADGHTCLRDAYAGHYFLTSLAAAQARWDL